MSNIKFNNIHTVIKYFAMITYVKLAYLFIFEVSFIKIRSSQLDLGAWMPCTFIFCQWINWLDLDTATLCQSRSLSPSNFKTDTRSWLWLIWKQGASLFYRRGDSIGVEKVFCWMLDHICFVRTSGNLLELVMDVVVSCNVITS